MNVPLSTNLLYLPRNLITSLTGPRNEGDAFTADLRSELPWGHGIMATSRPIVCRRHSSGSRYTYSTDR